MGKFIDRQKLEAHFSPAITGKEAYTAGEVLLSIQKFPSADVVPVVHAHWLKINNPNYSPFDQSSEYYLFCSNCECGHVQMYNFCPSCGAKMDEE